MRISVIICTRNRAYALPTCLDTVAAALERIRPETGEIVVVDNASEDETSAVVTKWGKTSAVPVRLIFEPSKGKSVALNAGIIAFRGHVLAFTDDDCWLDENYFVDALRHDEADKELTLRGGRVELGDPTDLPLTIKTARLTMQWQRRGPGPIPVTLRESIIGCNMVSRRTLFDRIGFFDERFGPGAPFHSCDDVDLIYRAYASGVFIEYVPDMVVYHYHGRKSAEDARKLMRTYNLAIGAFYAKAFFAEPSVARSLRWDIQRAIREFFGGPNMIPAQKISYRDVVGWTIKGALEYWTFALSRHARPLDSHEAQAQGRSDG